MSQPYTIEECNAVICERQLANTYHHELFCWLVEQLQELIDARDAVLEHYENLAAAVGSAYKQREGRRKL